MRRAVAIFLPFKPKSIQIFNSSLRAQTQQQYESHMDRRQCSYQQHPKTDEEDKENKKMERMREQINL